MDKKQQEELEAELNVIGDMLEELWNKYGLSDGKLEISTCSGIAENGGLYTSWGYPNGTVNINGTKNGFRSEFPNTWQK